MTFESVVRSSELSLPIETQSDCICDERFLSDIFEKYLALIAEISETVLEIEGLKGPVRKESFVKIQQDFANGIILSFKEYLNGNPSKAYYVLEGILNNRIAKYGPLLNTCEYPVNSRFYKIRITDAIKQLGDYEMFHIPFEKRAKISTQRFSIPGFPTLYIGTSLYVCWEELLRPAVDNFQVVRLESQKTLRMLDLTYPSSFQNYYHKSAYKYLATWPLVAACSIKVAYRDSNFKPEYIIPQLLLQWVRNNRAKIRGIRYSSTHISKPDLRSNPCAVNLAIPVFENQKAGLCPTMLSEFNMAGPISWQLKHLALGGQIFMGSGDQPKDKLQRIEIIRGMEYPYNYSILGNLESYLDAMQLREIRQNPSPTT